VLLQDRVQRIGVAAEDNGAIVVQQKTNQVLVVIVFHLEARATGAARGRYVRRIAVREISGTAVALQTVAEVGALDLDPHQRRPCIARQGRAVVGCL
jgi:hypothetical protein